MAVAGFESKRVHGVIAGVLQPVRLTGLEDRVVQRRRLIPRQVQLPPEFTLVGHPDGQHLVSGHFDVLRGADNERIRKFSHQQLTTYGIGMEYSSAEWMSIVRQLIHRGYLTQDIATFSVLKLTSQAMRLLRAEETLELARPRVQEKSRKKKKKPGPVADLSADDLRLFETLRELRKQLAREQGVPPYVIFGDAALLEMSRERPASEAQFLEINGVGQVKLERHGATFLEAIARDEA